MYKCDHVHGQPGHHDRVHTQDLPLIILPEAQTDDNIGGIEVLPADQAAVNRV